MKRECYISIVIITFNKLAYLKAVVANLMFQTVKENVELMTEVRMEQKNS